MLALFPGQGAQHVGMGKELYENFRIAREAFEEASDAAHLDLRKLCFDGPESDLTLTENTQPALLTASVAAFRVAREELGFKATAVAGHSLGEYSALVAAGSLQLDAAVRWVRERGRAMQKAVPVGNGTMAAILGIDDKPVQVLCAEATDEARRKRQAGEHADLKVEAIVEPANFNSPGQVVIAGSADAVAAALQLATAAGKPYSGAKAVPLDVSAPFHCRLMKPARDRMAELFSQAAPSERPKALSCPYVPNRTAKLCSDPALVFDLLIEQVDHPVLWKQSVVHLMHAGFARGVEFGPGKVLQGLVKRIARAEKGKLEITGLSDRTSFDEVAKIIKEGTQS